MIWSFALFVPICACYLMWEFNAIKNATIMDLMKDFVDISPAIILLAFNRPQSAIFLMFCLMANEFIYDNWILGGALFAVGYATASFLACYGSGFYIVIALTAVLAILIFENTSFGCLERERKVKGLRSLLRNNRTFALRIRL